MKEKYINEGYALLFQFIVVPIIGFLTYFVYDKFAYLRAVQGSTFLFIFIVACLVGLNILAIYGVGCLLHRKFNMQLIYYIITGAITIFVALWFKVYYVLIQNIECSNLTTGGCINSYLSNRSFTFMLIFLIIYYLVFIVMYKMIQKKYPISNKKKRKK